MSDKLLKTPVVVGNWKMHPADLRTAQDLFSDIKRTASHLKNTTTVVCPPSLFLGSLAGDYSGSKILLGSQDSSRFSGVGAQTGEVSGDMLAKNGVQVSIIGHSERRAMGENTKIIIQKIRATLSAELEVILCVGEKKRDDDGAYLTFLRNQIADVFSQIPGRFQDQISLAYEPLWAIGGEAESAVTPHTLHQTVLFLRKVLKQAMSQRRAEKMIILYGGSVKRDNARELFSGTDVDGFLVGGASLSADHFCDILRIVNEAYDEL